MPRLMTRSRSPARARACSTARSVRKVLALLAEQHPDGVRAGEQAAVVGKSTSTAFYLLREPRRGGVCRARPIPVPMINSACTAATLRPTASGGARDGRRRRPAVRRHAQALAYLGRVGHGGILESLCPARTSGLAYGILGARLADQATAFRWAGDRQGDARVGRSRRRAGATSSARPARLHRDDDQGPPTAISIEELEQTHHRGYANSQSAAQNFSLCT